MADTESPVESPKSFGIGSFCFSVKSDSEMTIEQLILNFSSHLRSIPGITDITIEPEFDAPREIPAGVVELSFLNIAFSMDLSSDPMSKTGEDTFDFVSRSFYDEIVTIIFSKFETDSPSEGVYKVRKYLERYSGNFYSLEILGPSPFHADFFIINTNFFGLKINKSRSYDRITVYVSAKTQKELTEEIFDKLGDELELFYLIRRCESSRIEEWHEVEEKVTKVLEKPPFLSLSLRDQLPFRRNRLPAAAQAIAFFEANSLATKQLINERFNGTYGVSESYLLPYIEKERNEVYLYPTESTQKLLEFIGDMRSSSGAITATYISVIINVVLGLAVTVLLFNLGVH